MAQKYKKDLKEVAERVDPNKANNDHEGYRTLNKEINKDIASYGVEVGLAEGLRNNKVRK